jgi:DNA polymerase
VVGEAPGKQEDAKGEPFVGPAGQFLRRSLRKAGLRPTDGAYFNAVSCYPDAVRTPQAEHVDACRGNLYAQLDIIDSPYVLVCGKVAFNALMPMGELTLAMGGPIDYGNKVLFPIYHPSYILRSNSRSVGDLFDRHLSIFASLVDGAPVTRDSLQIMNCIYCHGARMGGKIVCIRHEGKLLKDVMRKRTKLANVTQGTLFD